MGKLADFCSALAPALTVLGTWPHDFDHLKRDGGLLNPGVILYCSHA